MLSKDSNGIILLDSSLPITIDQFQKATKSKISHAEKYFEVMKGACKAFDINTELRLAAFFAQVGHESASLSTIEENLNYSATGLRNVFGKYFKSDQDAANYARKPMLIANRVYASRMGNGSELSGEGWKFRGRGLIQLTGKNNYKLISDYFEEDFISNPDKLLEPVWCALSACWFWSTNNLNALADKGDVVALTKKINGGTHGLNDRIERYQVALNACSGFDLMCKNLQA